MSTSLNIPSVPSGAVETDVVVNGDRRGFPRQDCHTLVTAVTSEDPAASDGWRVLKVHSEDVSITGAKLISINPIPGDEIFLRFLLPNFGKQFVRAKIVNQTTRDRTTLHGTTTRLFVYGVKFTGVVSDEGILEPLLTLTDSQPKG
ncbi:MAG: PilZ domain-containing protein [Planctomycetaceae bacterium]|nr:PilZ domain-containing protein [Planctomycetaceae bacterium]